MNRMIIKEVPVRNGIRHLFCIYLSYYWIISEPVILVSLKNHNGFELMSHVSELLHKTEL